MPADDFVYDAFISYRHQEPDKTWVRKTLLPRLEAEGLAACIDYRDFRLGAVVRGEREVVTPSGKGVDASLVIHELGGETVAAGLSAGLNGRLLTSLLDEWGIHHDFFFK